MNVAYKKGISLLIFFLTFQLIIFLLMINPLRQEIKGLKISLNSANGYKGYIYASAHFPSAIDWSLLIQNLGRNLKKQKIRDIAIYQEKRGELNKKYYMPIILSASTNYFQLLTFLVKIVSQEPWIKIESLEIKRKIPQNNRGTIYFKLIFFCYYKGE